MEKLCKRIQNEGFKEIQENKSSINKKTMKHKNSDIRECFIEYTLEDKVAALKCMLDYNEKEAENAPVHSGSDKTSTGVKECLQGDQETQFQTLIYELRNTVMNSYWNKEVGKTHYQTPNLPIGMNPWETIFGKKTKFETSMTELLQAKANQMDILNPDILEMYKKSHNSYLPAEQINRNYEQPFNQNFRFGKFNNVDNNGTRVKKLLTWITSTPSVLINPILADFKERTHPRIGKVRNYKEANLFMDMVHGKTIKRVQTNIVSDSPLNDDVIKQKKYLQNINSLRQKYKKQIPEIPFLDIYEELSSLDKDYVGILSEDTVFSVLAKYKMYINKTYLTPLLDLLGIRKEENVNYTKLLNLLNWKYDFPTLPKIERAPLECQCCHTTYRDTIGSTEETDITKEVLHSTLKDGTTAYDLIFPSVFTRHGLGRNDLTKPRNKEEMKGIFENIGVQFPDNSFNLLWEKGLEKYNVQNLSVLTFRNLCDEYDTMINKKDS
ncbi:EF-hand domain-containing family member B isoform X1 [Halictus rubicundus]|uniref:EF-hand domain-containing family member B isoform X1 n=1 Tax=Halictus rubicundus TaxID=77578 RepID=UPI00403501A7